MPQHHSVDSAFISGDTALLAGNDGAPDLLLRHLPAAGGARGRPVLYVHGATFPSALSVGFRFAGQSWLELLSRTGCDAWSFDFAGFGGSARYPEMSAPAEAHPPLGRAPVAAAQIARVMRSISARHDGQPVNIVAHSWGCLAAGLFATQQPELVDKLVFFGPIVPRRMAGLPAPDSIGAWRLLTVEAQHARFVEDVPAGEAVVLEERDFPAWADAYLASDPAASQRQPPAVKVPAGPAADILAAWQGQPVYDPALIRAPVLIVRGSWDSLTTAADAATLTRLLCNAPAVLDREIPRATHLMHLEVRRTQLYRLVAEFLADMIEAEV